MRNNPATATMQKMAEMMIRTDQRLADMGAMPYGMRKATSAEQKRFVSQLNGEAVLNMMMDHGVHDVNVLLRKTMPKEQLNG